MPVVGICRNDVKWIMGYDILISYVNLYMVEVLCEYKKWFWRKYKILIR